MSLGMPTNERPSEADSLMTPDTFRLSRLMAAVAGSFFLVYGITAVIGALPPRPLDPGWIVRTAGLLTDNAAIPLVGVVLVFLASHLDPTSPMMRARRNRVAQLCRWAAIAFLLLIPAQLAASWTGVQQVGQNQGAQLLEASRKVAEIRKATEAATSTADLQARLQKIGGASLNPADLSQPIERLRPRYLKELSVTQSQVQEQQKNPVSTGQQLVVAQGTTKGLLMALAYGLGFAAAAPGMELYGSMLLDWKRMLRLPTIPGKRKVDANSSYMEALTRMEEGSDTSKD
jgi:hypothetical protein